MKNHCSYKAIGVAVFTLVALSAPLFAFAQTPRYGQSDEGTAFYLLPNRGFYGESASGPIASGLSISCAPMQPTIAFGQPVIWYSAVTGGTGNYFYAWNGSENFSGNASAMQKLYATNGEKFATLSVSSGSQTITVSCGSVQVGPVSASGTQGVTSVRQTGFGASCYATPERALANESVTWLSIVSGGTASTTYSWDGTDNLTGNRPITSKIYTSNGVKSAMLTVTSGNDRVVAACTNSITVGPKPVSTMNLASAVTVPKTLAKADTASTNGVQGLCSPSATTVAIGEKVKWQALSIGGAGDYTFVWQGDDKLSGSASTTEVAYDTEGVKQASVTVLSGNTNKSITCNPVTVTAKSKGLFAASWFGWISGPLLFIIAGIIAILIGILIARRKKAKEDIEDSGDFKPDTKEH